MGWFWSEVPAPSENVPVNSNAPRVNGPESLLGGLFWAPQPDIWADDVGITAQRRGSDAGASKCPIDHTKLNWFSKKAEGNPKQVAVSDEPKCPVDHSKFMPSGAAAPAPPADTPKCPVDHSKFMSKGAAARHETSAAAAPVAAADPPAHSSDALAAPASACPVNHSGMNSLNNMPTLAQSKIAGQTVDLPTERMVSTIPRGQKDGEGFWEYPSPQQMLNAMVRKSGPDGIEEDAVESMVDVHNFLNEGVWREVLEWEKPYTEESSVTPRLLRFQGRPGELSPRARMIQLLGWFYPSKYGTLPPFDRHDWTVLRAVPGKADEWQQVRYVIDFYEVPEEGPDDVPTFSVDVRPAADSVQNIVDRASAAWGPSISKALGRS